MSAKFHLANVITAVGALMVFIGSFLTFYKYERGDESFNAWDTEWFAFASTLPVVLAVAALIWIVLEVANLNLPDNVML